ncbi:MAG: hypothetical protein AB7N24_04655 [Dehalococcoidia bacterium]
MISRLFQSSADAELEAAMNGALPAHENLEPLVELAAELREFGIDTPQPRISPARREEFLMAVRAEAARERSRRPAARIKGATMSIAAVAGAGLVVAGAASGSNPAALVVDAARDLPGIPQHVAPPAETSIEGEVVATRDDGRTLEVRSGDATVVVEAPKESRDVTSAGTPVPAAAIAEGDNIRVTSKRAADSGGVITAKKIEVLPADSASAAPGPKPTISTNSGAAAAPTKDVRPAVSTGAVETPVDAAALKPTATPTPHLDAKTPSVAANLDVRSATVSPTITKTATPTPPPTKTPTPRPKTVTPAPSDSAAAEFNTKK